VVLARHETVACLVGLRKQTNREAQRLGSSMNGATFSKLCHLFHLWALCL
jgi:hypothetical protein